jgi:hypothetical protein
MRLRRRPLALLAIVLLCIASRISVGPATAQSTGGGSSSDNSPLQMLQSLSPDQRDAIMNQLGIGGGGNTGGGLGGGTGGTGGLGGLGGLGTQSAPGRQRPTEEMEEQEADARSREQQQRQFDEEQELLSPYFKGDDWLIITIDAYPAQGNSLMQNLQPQGGGAASIPGAPNSPLSQLPPGAASSTGALIGGIPTAAIAAGSGAAGGGRGGPSTE